MALPLVVPERRASLASRDERTPSGTVQRAKPFERRDPGVPSDAEVPDAQENASSVQVHEHRVAVALELVIGPEILADFAALSHATKGACVPRVGQIFLGVCLTARSCAWLSGAARTRRRPPHFVPVTCSRLAENVKYDE
jgi:hypothetical protein